MILTQSSTLCIPPLSEQEAIAEALSDADALIESIEQLIAKKRQLKQGAMQEAAHRQGDGCRASARSGRRSHWENSRMSVAAELPAPRRPSSGMGGVPWVHGY